MRRAIWMSWACEVAAMRLLKKCKKETLIMLCNDFGIPTSGNKEKLAEDAAEQMHYETDDESDDESRANHWQTRPSSSTRTSRS